MKTTRFEAVSSCPLTVKRELKAIREEAISWFLISLYVRCKLCSEARGNDVESYFLVSIFSYVSFDMTASVV